MGNFLQAGGQLVQGGGSFAASRARARALQGEAQDARRLGEVEARRRGAEGRREVATATTRAAASGFTVEGSALDVIAHLAQENDADARAARWEAGRRAMALRNEARQVKAQGNIALVSGLLGAGSALFSGTGGSGQEPKDVAAAAAKGGG